MERTLAKDYKEKFRKTEEEKACQSKLPKNKTVEAFQTKK